MYRTYGARDFACYLFPALAGWANVWRTYGAFGRGWPARRTRGAKKDAGLPDTNRRDLPQFGGKPGATRTGLTSCAPTALAFCARRVWAPSSQGLCDDCLRGGKILHDSALLGTSCGAPCRYPPAGPERSLSQPRDSESGLRSRDAYSRLHMPINALTGHVR